MCTIMFMYMVIRVIYSINVPVTDIRKTLKVKHNEVYGWKFLSLNRDT